MDLLLYTDIDTYTEELVDSIIMSLPPSQQQRIMKEKLLSRRREKVIAYKLLWDYLLKNGLFHEMPEIAYAAEGKPYLSNYPELFISISHCKNAVAVAVNKGNVGVDVESIRKYSPTLVDRSFNDKERELIAQAKDKDSEFSRLWTRKEAYLKYVGTGITGMDSLQQVPPEDARIETHPLPKNNGWISICY